MKTNQKLLELAEGLQDDMDATLPERLLARAVLAAAAVVHDADTRIGEDEMGVEIGPYAFERYNALSDAFWEAVSLEDER